MGIRVLACGVGLFGLLREIQPSLSQMSREDRCAPAAARRRAALRSVRGGESVARLASSLLLIALSASPLGCNEKSDCEKACARFAACKAARKNGGEAVLGEGRAPIDDACMTKCERQPDIFAACEGRLKDCDKMLACSGSLRW